MSRRTLAAAAVAGGAALATAVAARRADARWGAADDPYAPNDLLLPIGDARTVHTDDGADLAVLVAGPGDGAVVVLAHCWTGGREVWAPVAHRLIRRGHRVVLYDQRGHGSSTIGRGGLTIERLGGDLNAVLAAVDAHDAVLVGHSMGGMTVMSFATHHPEVLAARTRAIVLASTAASGLSRGSQEKLAARVVASALLGRVMRGRMGHALVRGSVGRAVHRSHLVLTRDLFVATAPEVRSGWLTAMLGMDLRRGIATIGVPATIMVGSRDQLTPAARAAELVSTIPNAHLVTIEDAGHMLPLEAPDEVATAIASLSGIAGGTTSANPVLVAESFALAHDS